jgi:hypothetical protein
MPGILKGVLEGDILLAQFRGEVGTMNGRDRRRRVCCNGRLLLRGAMEGVLEDPLWAFGRGGWRRMDLGWDFCSHFGDYFSRK